MPQLTGSTMLQIALLLSAVPAQYYISRWSGSTSAQRYHATTRLLRIWKDLRTSFLNGTAWMNWANQQISKAIFLVGLEGDQDVQAPHALEDMMVDNNKGFFGASKAVRSPRPPYVFLRVGDVVKDQMGLMIGVIVSWDSEMRAPQEWVERVYSNSKGLKAENTPHYKVLFSGPRSSSLLIAYLPQTQLQRIIGTRPQIPTLDKYFTHYDGKRFHMRPWLREIFPEDDPEDE